MLILLDGLGRVDELETLGVGEAEIAHEELVKPTIETVPRKQMIIQQ